MKKLTLSIAAIAAMGTFAVAGGDIAPVEPVVETPAVIETTTDAGFYIGAAYGLLNYDVTISDYKGMDSSGDNNFNEFLILAGYKINPYVAIEGRYWYGSNDDLDYGRLGVNDTSVDAWGVYVKPMYPVTDQFDVYALLGYGANDVTVKTPNADVQDFLGDDNDGFTWGLGGSYDVNANVAVFIDFVRVYDDTITYQEYNSASIDKTVDTWNFGVTYKF
jgi:opacity protein-like surface antigen